MLLKISSSLTAMATDVRIVHHRRRTRASPVLTAIGLVNGKPWEIVIFHPPQNRHTLTDH